MKNNIWYLVIFIILASANTILLADGLIPTVIRPIKPKTIPTIEDNKTIEVSKPLPRQERSINNPNYCNSRTANCVLKLYGGENFDIFLGELNTNAYQENSIWNRFGTYGNKLSVDSIWNKFGNYGGSLHVYSPFNSFTSSPPAIFDIDGNFYGYLTVNRNKSYRSSLYLADIICDNWKKACDDSYTVYNKASSYINY